MSGGTERGKWLLPTGESVVAKVDDEGVESVYVGARLVSRAPRGRMLTGHPVKQRGDGDGAYRGGRDVRVFFDEDGSCRCVVDGEAWHEAIAPPPPPPAPKTLRTIASVVVFALWIILVLVLPSKSKIRRGAAPAPTATASARAELPITETYRSQNVPVVLHYPRDFSLTYDRKVGSDNAILHLEQRDDYAVLEVQADKKPDTLDVWKLDQTIQGAMEKGWAARKTFVKNVERSDGKCLGQPAAVVLRQLDVDGSPIREWSCTIVYQGHSYRFVTYVPNRVAENEARLRTIIEATEVY